MENQRKKIGIYLNLQKYTELKSFCVHLGLSMTHFIDLAIEDRIKKEMLKLKKTKKGEKI